jgi:hypothetical protein
LYIISSLELVITNHNRVRGVEFLQGDD